MYHRTPPPTSLLSDPKPIFLLPIQIHDFLIQSRFFHCFFEIGERREEDVVVTKMERGGRALVR